jgi:SAM-dependent methyltransferase
MATEGLGPHVVSVAKALTRVFFYSAFLLTLSGPLTVIAGAQEPATTAVATNVAGTNAPATKIVPAPAFFESQAPIELTLTANLSKLRGDKSPDAPWRAATLSYKGPDGNAVTVPLRARTRGIWRLKTCDFPPLRLNFSSATSGGSIFDKLDKPKLVSHCEDRDGFEQYILQEFQLYRIYHLLTPVSHNARLLKLTYADSGSGNVRAKRYGFLIEQPSALAARLGGKIMEQKGAGAGDLDPYQNALMSVFQYMIGNTDFSVAGLHNIELFFTDDGNVLPIAYDFDFAGAVNARYAVPDMTLNLPNVRRRLFRGYCTDADSYAKVFTLFKEKKPEIYALYNDEIGKLMDRRTVEETLRYYDEFYKTINDPRSAKRSIIESCIPRP